MLKNLFTGGTVQEFETPYTPQHKIGGQVKVCEVCLF